MSEHVYIKQDLNVLLQRLKREDNAAVENRQDWRLMFEKLYLEYKDDFQDDKMALDKNAVIKKDAALDGGIENKFYQELNGDALLTKAHSVNQNVVSLNEVSLNQKIIIPVSRNLKGPVTLSSYSSATSELRFADDLSRKSAPSVAAKSTRTFDNAAEYEKSAVRILQTEDGFHLIVRDANVTQEAMRWIFSKIKNALAQHNAKLSAVILNGEVFWSQSKEEQKNSNESVEVIHFDKQY